MSPASELTSGSRPRDPARTLVPATLLGLTTTVQASTGLPLPAALGLVSGITALTLGFFLTGHALGLDRS